MRNLYGIPSGVVEFLLGAFFRWEEMERMSKSTSWIVDVMDGNLKCGGECWGILFLLE